MTILRHIVRFAVAALVLLFVGAIVPNFAINGFWNAFVAALVIAALGWVIEALFGKDVSPYSRGVVGFFISALVIYLTGFFLSGVRVSIMGALIAALVIGIIDLFVPIKRQFTGEERS